MEHIPVFMAIVSIGHFLFAATDEATQCLVLGAQYAESLGINTPNTQLSARCYRVAGSHYHCFCGPIGFIGLAVPLHRPPPGDHRKPSFLLPSQFSAAH